MTGHSSTWVNWPAGEPIPLIPIQTSAIGSLFEVVWSAECVLVTEGGPISAGVARGLADEAVSREAGLTGAGDSLCENVRHAGGVWVTGGRSLAGVAQEFTGLSVTCKTSLTGTGHSLCQHVLDACCVLVAAGQILTHVVQGHARASVSRESSQTSTDHALGRDIWEARGVRMADGAEGIT